MANVVPLVEEGTAIPLFSFGQVDDTGEVIRDSAFPELPSFAEAYAACAGAPPSGPGWEAYRAVLIAGFAAQKNLWTHRDAPEERIGALRAAAEATARDPEFMAMATELLGGYSFFLGPEAETTFRRATSLDPEARAWLLDLLREKYDVTL